MKKYIILSILLTFFLGALAGMTLANELPTEKILLATTPASAEQSYAKSNGESLTPNNIMAATNEERKKHNLHPLATSEQLNKSACMKLDNMVQDGYWSHDNPNGTKPWFYFKEVGYKYKGAGENLAYGQLTTPGVMKDWMNSKAHRENLLEDSWLEQGACAKFVKFQNGDVFLMVHHFGVRS